jgi:hypothetical protein
MTMPQIAQTLGFIHAPVAGVRGLGLGPGSLLLQSIRHVALLNPALLFRGEKLKPGEEVSVTVPVTGMPLSVDIKRVKAKIEIHEDDDEPEPLKQSSTIKEGGESRTFEVAVQTPPLPRNVSVRLDGGDAFWSFGDVAVRGAYELPDFAREANAYLDTLPQETREVALKFLVKADGPGRIKLDIEQLEYSIIQTQSWENPLDDTQRLDRTFELDFGAVETVPLDPPLSSAAASLTRSKLSFSLGGEFGPERLLTSFKAHAGREFASISSSYSLAQSFQLSRSILGSEKPINCVGVAGLFVADAEGAKNSQAEIYVEMQTDEAGSPAAQAPLSKSNLAVPLPEGAAGGSVFAPHEYRKLLFARFEAPVTLRLDTPYWIVVKGVQGKVRLGLEPPSEEYLRQVLVNRGGQLWKRVTRPGAPPVAAFVRLVYLPEIDNQMAAVEIGVEGARATQRSDPGPRAQSVSFDAREVGGARQVSLVIKSHARGTLSIANVIQEYAPSADASVFQVASAQGAAAR